MSQDLKMTKNGIEVDIRVNTTFGGRFEATVGDEQLDALTWAELEKLVDRATKRVARTVKIEFTLVAQHVDHITGKVVVNLKHGVATGLHSGNGNVLAQIRGNPVQFSRYERNHHEIYRPFIRAEAEEYGRLLKAQHDAQNAVSAWRDERRIDLEKLVIAALNEGAAPTQE
jgi:hypothetical protein